MTKQAPDMFAAARAKLDEEILNAEEAIAIVLREVSMKEAFLKGLRRAREALGDAVEEKPAEPRRKPGEVEAAVLKLFRDHPRATYFVEDVARLANVKADSARAALARLAGKGEVRLEDGLYRDAAPAQEAAQ